MSSTSGSATEAGRSTKVLGRLKRAATGAPPPAEPDAPTVLDELTGLPVRHHLHDRVARAVRRSSPLSSRVVVAFVSIGLLRDVNDSFGADRGDDLLVAVAERLQTIDLPGTEVLRHEGAELVVVFEQLNNANANEEIARFLVELLGAPFALGDDTITIDPVVGTAISADQYADVDELIRDAHRSLAHARDAGLDYEIHDESQRGRYETRIDEARLRTAVDNHEFLLHYQPIVTAGDASLVGFEALLRWRAPGATNAGVMHPRGFLPMLEKSGLTVNVGHWAVHECCRQIAGWNAGRPATAAPLFITTNISPRHLADAGFAASVIAAVRSTGIEPSWLCLDLTEAALRVNGPQSWPPLRELAELGVRIAIDDFGTGAASLHWLLELSVDFVRIDRSFVSQLGANVHNVERGRPDPVSVVVAHLTSMATDLGVQVVAEGVENDDELLAVERLGIPLLQGYRFGHAEPAAVATERVSADLVPTTQWRTEDVLERPFDGPDDPSPTSF